MSREKESLNTNSYLFTKNNTYLISLPLFLWCVCVESSGAARRCVCAVALTWIDRNMFTSGGEEGRREEGSRDSLTFHK